MGLPSALCGFFMRGDKKMNVKDKKALEALLWLAFNTQMDCAEIDMSLGLSDEDKLAVDGWDIDIDKLISGAKP